MVDRRKVEALLNAQSVAGSRLFEQMRRLFRPALTRLGSSGWYFPKQYEPVAQQFADMSRAAQRARADVTSRFTQAVLHELGEDVKAPVTDITDLRGGVDPLTVWSRPIEEYRYQVSTGKPPAEALELAAKRAESIADDNLQMAARKASQETMQRSKTTVGYRRVIRPELSKGSCGLCIAASTRLYLTENLRAIHENCNCENLPVTRADDIGHVLNTYDLKKLYADNAGSNDGQQLKYIRYQVDEHGELGPVLRRQGHGFRDQGDVKSATGRSSNQPDPAPADAARMRDEWVAELNKLLDRRKAGEDVAQAIKAAKATISRLNSIASRAA